MSNIITVNLENLTDAERQQLMSLVEKSKKAKQWWEGTKFDIKENENYYTILPSGGVEADRQFCTQVDGNRINFGNACKDRDYMERRAKEIKLYNLLSNFAEVVNEGWTPNWKDKYEEKYCLYYDCFQDKWHTIYTFFAKYPTEVYFKSKELAQRAINEIILPFERGEL